MAAILAVAGTTLAVWIGSATHEERASETATVSRPAQDSAPRQAAALPASHPVNPTVPPAERPSLPAGTVPSTSETAATSFSPAPVAVLPSASEPDRIAALPDIHPVSPTALPAEQPPSSADNAPSAPETARASSQPSPVADSLPARESDQTAALPETRMVGTATMPPEQTSPPVDNAPSSASTSPAPAANSLSAPETDQTAALPDAHSIDPATMPAEAPSLPADNAPSTRETANGAALVTVDPTITSERIPTIVPPRRLGAPGLVLVAGTGDSLAGLYAKVYRGLKPPPYSVFVAANHTPVTPGTLVVFPEPPEGWPSR